MTWRAATYNIHHWEGIDGRIDVARVAEVVRGLDADLVALNEVYHPWTAPDDDRAALMRMAETLGMTVAFGAALHRDPAGASSATGYGNALLSRWPILAHATHKLTGAPGHEPRILLEVRVQHPSGRPLTAYVTHLDHRSEEVRWSQAQSLLLWTARDRGRPHLLLGDLNALAPGDYGAPGAWERLEAEMHALGFDVESPRVLPRLLSAGYVDAMAASGSPVPTWSTERPQLRIDYILVSEPLAPVLVECVRFEAAPAPVASDHFPVVATFDGLPG